MSKKKIPPPTKGKCPICGIDIITEVPFIDGELCGRKSVDHGCGEKATLVEFFAPDFMEEISKELEKDN